MSDQPATTAAEGRLRNICASTARSEYGLNAADLDEIPCVLTRNPYYRNAAPMRLYQVGDVESYAAWKRDYFSAESKASRKANERRMKVELVQGYEAEAAAMRERMHRWSREYERRVPLDNDTLCLVMEALADKVEPSGVYGPSLVAQDLTHAAQTCKQMYRAHHAGMRRLGRIMVDAMHSSSCPRVVQDSAYGGEVRCDRGAPSRVQSGLPARRVPSRRQAQAYDQSRDDKCASPYDNLPRGVSLPLVALKDICRDLGNCKVTGDKIELTVTALIELRLIVHCPNNSNESNVDTSSLRAYQLRPTTAPLCTVWAAYVERQERRVYERFYADSVLHFMRAYRAFGLLASHVPQFETYCKSRHALVVTHGIRSMDSLVNAIKEKEANATATRLRAVPLGVCPSCTNSSAERCSVGMCARCCKARNIGRNCPRHRKFF